MPSASNRAVRERLISASHSFAITLVLLAALLSIGHATNTARPLPSILLPVASAWLFLLAGVSLWLRVTLAGRWSRWGSACFAASLSAIALLACIAYVQPSFGKLGGIDQLWRVVGLMSPQAAVAFLLGGLGLLSLGWEARYGIWSSQACALGIVFITCLALLGYLYGVPSLYQLSSHPAIHVHESAALLLLGLAILFARPDAGLMGLISSDTSGGALARRMPVAVVVTPLMLGWLALRGERAGWWGPAAGLSMLVSASIAFFSMLVFRVARSFDRSETERTPSEEKFRAMFRSSPDAMVVSRIADGEILEVNEGFSQVTGFSSGDIVGRTTAELDFKLELPERAEPMENALAGVRNARVRIRTKSGEERLGLCSTENVNLGGERCLLTMTRDVSDQQRAQEALQEANTRLAQWVADLETQSREISMLNDMSGVLQSCVTPDEACAIAVQFGQQLLPGSAGAIYKFAEVGGVLETAAVWGDLSSGVVFTPLECWALRRGRPYVVEDSTTGIACAHVQEPGKRAYFCVPMMAQGETLGVLHVRNLEASASSDSASMPSPDSTLRMVEAFGAHVGLALANVRLRERLRRQSVRDELTGLYNRRYMEESLERELLRARRMAGTLSLALLDLDQFKAINDERGHDAGDELLKAMGQIFRTVLRGGDIICRYGGDEFLFVMPAMELSAAFDRVGEVCSAVQNAVVWHRGQPLPRVSASAGIVAFPDHGETAAQLLSAADAAMYRAKTRGGNTTESGDKGNGVFLPKAG